MEKNLSCLFKYCSMNIKCDLILELLKIHSGNMSFFVWSKTDSFEIIFQASVFCVSKKEAKFLNIDSKCQILVINVIYSIVVLFLAQIFRNKFVNFLEHTENLLGFNLFGELIILIPLDMRLGRSQIMSSSCSF